MTSTSREGKWKRNNTARAEAKAIGAPRYFTGNPCPKGHVAERNTRDGSCVECQREHSAKRNAAGFNREYFQKNKPQMDAYRRAYREKNLEDLRKKRRLEYQKNRDYYMEYAAKWLRENPEKYREYVRTAGHRRRSAINASESHFTTADVKRILKSQRGRCAYHAHCGQHIRKSFHIDHIKPLSKGGHNGASNIQLTCKSCNLRKSNKAPEEWAEHIGLLL